jgi:hypothetical protein
MTEAEWLGGAELWPLLELGRDRCSVRKLRLLGNAFFRRYYHPGDTSRADVLDRQVDDPLFADAPGNAANFAWQMAASCTNKLYRDAVAGCDKATHAARVAEGTHLALYESLEREFAAPETVVQCQLAPCVFGNPFRPVTVDPSWRTSDVVALARGVYDERAFDRLPVLADALQDAGCEDEQVLGHCRGPGPHARGCGVIDGLLGKA